MYFFSILFTAHLPNLANHIPNLDTHRPNLATHLPTLATHLLPNLATHLPNIANHLPNLATETEKINTLERGKAGVPASSLYLPLREKRKDFRKKKEGLC